jgi:hypothetical protein
MRNVGVPTTRGRNPRKSGASMLVSRRPPQTRAGTGWPKRGHSWPFVGLVAAADGSQSPLDITRWRARDGSKAIQRP